MKILKPHEKIPKPDFALLDFDGTVSKLRNGWDVIMRDLFIDMIPGDREEVKALAEKLKRSAIFMSCSISDCSTEKRLIPLPLHATLSIGQNGQVHRSLNRRKRGMICMLISPG